MTQVTTPVVVQQIPKPKRNKYVQKGKQATQQVIKEEGHKQEKKQKPRRKHDDQYNYDPTVITQDMVLPKLPKKNQILIKPDEKQYKTKETEIIEKIKAAKEKRSKILAEKFEREKKNAKGQPVEKTIFTQFEAQKEQVIKLREEFLVVLDEIKSRKQKLERLFDEQKEIDHEIDQIDRTKKGDTKQNIFEKLRRLEKQLLTASLSLKQEKFLQMEISQLKSSINTATSTENLQIQLARLKQKKIEIQQQINNLRGQKRVYQGQFDIIKPKLDSQNQKVNKLKQEIKKQKEQKKLEFDEAGQQRQKFYENKTKRKETVDKQIQRLRDSIDALWQEYQKKYDQFSKQQRYINFVEWQTRQKAKLIRQKQYDQKRKQYEERQKQRQAKESIKVRKYDNQIKTCTFLIDYCQRLRPAEIKEEVKAVEKLSTEELNSKIVQDGQWKKEKGVTILQSKKDKDLDFEVVSKKNKNKKKQVHVQKQKVPEKPKTLTLDFQILNAFELIRVLPPTTVEQITRAIKELKQKQEAYLKMSTQEENTTQAEKNEVRKPVRQQAQERRKEQEFPDL